jgi:hypothetical protein
MKDKKNNRLWIKLSEEQKHQVKRNAMSLGLSLSSYVRKTALDEKIIGKTDLEMIHQVKKIGYNINQISRELNRYSDGMIISDAYKQMEEYKELLQALIKELSE